MKALSRKHQRCIIAIPSLKVSPEAILGSRCTLTAFRVSKTQRSGYAAN